MGSLTPREREVVWLRFEEDLTQAAIGGRIGVSRMQVSRVLRQAIARLRTLAAAEHPQLRISERHHRCAAAAAMGRRRIRSAVVTETQITLRILRRGPRADELLAHVARRFGPDRVRRDDFDAVKIRVSARAAVAWDDVRDALDGAGSDWRQWVYLPPRPFGRRA
jgi:hypothetical protein